MLLFHKLVVAGGVGTLDGDRQLPSGRGSLLAALFSSSVLLSERLPSRSFSFLCCIFFKTNI